MRTHVVSPQTLMPSVMTTDAIKPLGRPQQQGYARAIAEMTQRFDVNNKEMNKKKFQD